MEEKQYSQTILYDVLYFDKHEDYKSRLIKFITDKLNKVSSHELMLSTLFETPKNSEKDFKSFRNIMEAQHSGVSFINDHILYTMFSHPDNFFSYYIDKIISTDKIFIVSFWKAIILMDEQNFNDFKSEDNKDKYFTV